MIPNWNISGVLPPIRPNKSGNQEDRSPYIVQLAQVVNRFAISQKRMEIISGLIEYRKALYDLGVDRGFQWLDGSFMENIESLENRPPKDIDVVTFFYLPEGMSQVTLAEKNSDLFNPTKAKAQFKVDGYTYILGECMTDYHVQMISYWYSLWSHRRNGAWKGFLQVNLSTQEDQTALEALKLIPKEGDQS